LTTVVDKPLSTELEDEGDSHWTCIWAYISDKHGDTRLQLFHDPM